MSQPNKKQIIKQFNENNEPFYLVDHKDTVSLCFVFHPTPFHENSLGQDAFNRYAESIGEPVKDQYGLFTHGCGYEWEYVFRKAFEDDPNIDRITFDCEAGGFFCYGKDAEMMADFGKRFKDICEDENKLFDIVREAVPEFEERENMGMNM